MSGVYAQRTAVSPEKSRAELEKTLSRYGASRFGYATEPGRAMVQFEAHDRRIRFIIPMPDVGARMTLPQREQRIRQLWRALVLVVKAKLEAVSAGITTFEDEFLAHTLLPDGRTFGDWTRDPANAAALHAGNMPPMLPPPK